MGERNSHWVHFIIVNLIRIILVGSFFHAFRQNRPIIQVVSLVAIFFTFVPYLLKELFRIDLPVSFEVLYLMVVYGVLTYGEFRGFFSGLWWWSVLTTFTAGVALGFVALSVVHVLYKNNRISSNPVFASVLIFCFSITLGVSWELFEFVLDVLIHSGLQKGLFDTMKDLSVDFLSAILVSFAGYFHFRNNDSNMVSTFFSGLIESNIQIFGGRKIVRSLGERILQLISVGESEILEFKSSFRFNLHTLEFDKKMELGVLKTVVAFLNSKGGNLLVGVGDDGEVLGLEGDGFSSVDKMGLYFTNLIRRHIGNEFLPFIKFKIVNLDGKLVAFIGCEKSKKQVFLKNEKSEEFYVRNGPASVRLDGSSLVNYIRHKFG